MKLKVQVEELTFTISVGQGYNDFLWLALAAARLYGKSKYPPGNYQPCSLTINSNYIHPRTKICKKFKEEKLYKEQEETFEPPINVELYKPNMELNDDQKNWFNQGFKECNLMNVQFELFFEKPDQKKNYIPTNIFMNVNYNMYKEMKLEYIASEYPTKRKIQFQNEKNPLYPNYLYYKAIIEKLPFGEITNDDPIRVAVNDESKFEVIKFKENEFMNQLFYPPPESQEEIFKKIKESMKIPEQLSQQLQQQEAEIKKDVQTGSFCPYSFETLWAVIENNSDAQQINEFEENIKEKISKIINENLNKLYEIFFQYSMLYIQRTDKKDDIIISLQDVMHFIKFYEVLPDSQALFNFIDFYEQQGKRMRMSDFRYTLDIEQGIKFPEFVLIILKATQHLQTINPMADGESFDLTLDSLIKKIVAIDNNEDDLNEFQKHMKYNMTLMNFIRENSEQLSQLFLDKLQDSLQVQDRKYHLLKEEIKGLICEAGFKGDNLDEIVNTCYNELLSEEKYSGYEGIFYFEFLQVIQWLSLVLIADQDDDYEEKKNQDEEQQQEEGIEILIEKFKFFLNQFK